MSNKQIAQRGVSSAVIDESSSSLQENEENLAENTSSSKLLSSTSSFLVIINFISVGYIILPGGFAVGGTILTTVILVMVSIQSYMTSLFVLEACARAETLLQHDLSKETVDRAILPSETVIVDDDALFRPATVRHESEADLDGDNNDAKSTNTSPIFSKSIQVQHRKFELSTLTTIFLGRKWSHFFTVTTSLDLYGVTWTLAAIFASALADEFQIFSSSRNDDYMFFIGIFAVIAIPLACTTVLDQFYIQMVFLAARMLMVLLMVGTLAAAFANPNKAYFGDQIGPATTGMMSFTPPTPLANWREIVQAIQTAIFGTAFQFGVPAIGQVTRKKKNLSRIFQASVLFIFVSNLILGLLVSTYFGTATNLSNNLNWSKYHGGTVHVEGGPNGANNDFSVEDRSMWSSVISYYVVLFAAIDGVAVYPLIAASLGDILMGAIFGDNVHDMEQNWKIRTAFRLLGSAPQTIGALFVSDLGDLAKYAGIFTLLSYTFCPALLRIASSKKMKEMGLPSKTYYSSYLFSCAVWAYALVILVVLLIIAVIVDATVLS